MNKKQYPLPMTVDEQIKNLKDLGLIISDEESAKRFLNDVSYFRLIKGCKNPITLQAIYKAGNK